MIFDSTANRWNTVFMSKKPRRRRVDLAGDLRRAIRDSGLTPSRIAADADVDRGLMSRFVTGQRGVTLTTADRLCEVLGLELRPIRRATKAR